MLHVGAPSASSLASAARIPRSTADGSVAVPRFAAGSILHVGAPSASSLASSARIPRSTADGSVAVPRFAAGSIP
jgi:hypothetical protein